jgi:hypothetical protein
VGYSDQGGSDGYVEGGRELCEENGGGKVKNGAKGGRRDLVIEGWMGRVSMQRTNDIRCVSARIQTCMTIALPRRLCAVGKAQNLHISRNPLEVGVFLVEVLQYC